MLWFCWCSLVSLAYGDDTDDDENGNDDDNNDNDDVDRRPICEQYNAIREGSARSVDAM